VATKIFKDFLKIYTADLAPCTNDTDTERCSLVGRLGLSVFDISLGIASIERERARRARLSYSLDPTGLWADLKQYMDDLPPTYYIWPVVLLANLKKWCNVF
jgi:hypothetical protein